MELFTIISDGYINNNLYKKNRFNIQAFKDNLIIGIKVPNSAPNVIADGITGDTAYRISQYLQSLGCIIRIEKSKFTEISEQEMRAQRYFARASAPVLCPRCGSNQITAGQRGFNIITGFIGSNKTVNRCAKCGFSWKP